jgi:hypothetical protein
MAPEPALSINPYVGPRTFAPNDRQFFFGREREARDLHDTLVYSNLVLFYAQSGAGKSSLIHARVIPLLQEDEFEILPIGRVGGEMPPGVEKVENIYVYNLILSLEEGNKDPSLFASMTLADFLNQLTTDDGQHFTYGGTNPGPIPQSGDVPRRVLIIDQFEEIFTAHPERWIEREGFFRQLRQAMQDDPYLHVLLAMREDYVAALDPFAPLVIGGFRTRYYMERMGVAAALEAITRPAELSGRPFAADVALRLVDDLRQIRVPGQVSTVPGQYIEPVQLQVICYQLWENIKQRPPGVIGVSDLAEAGDVDRALTQFYDETLAVALADPAAAGVSERQLRTWFDRELITESGTCNLVRQGESETAGLPNSVVRELQRRFLVRGEARGGDSWIELAHDRFVEPIRASNAAWFPQHLSALQRQAALWDEQGRSSGVLLRDAALAEAEAWAANHPEELGPDEQQFLSACRQAQSAAERERGQSRRIRILTMVAVAISLISIAIVVWALMTRCPG